jgi:hypothetical protein
VSGVPIPDAEAVVGNYLRADPGVEAIVGNRVGTTLRGLSEPQVRITLFDPLSADGSRTDHLIENFLQFDCYAGSNNSSIEASLLVRTVRAVLRDMPGVRDGATVSKVEFTGGGHIPDTDIEPARERYVLEATVWIHP